MGDGATIGERYAAALASGRAADIILAAGLASQGDPMRGLALHLWRMRHVGDRTGFDSVCAVFDGWLYRRARRIGFKNGAEHSQEQVIRRALEWWLDPICRACDGRGHPLRPMSNVVETTRACEACDGSGQASLERLVRAEYHYAAKEVVNELDRICAEVFGGMGRQLRGMT